MKRFLVTILSMLYLVSATGATEHVHYCMGKIKAISFTHPDNDQCSTCGMEKGNQKGCCKDEQKTFKATDHQHATTAFDFTPQLAEVSIIRSYTFYHEPAYMAIDRSIAQAHAPPFLWRSCPIYLSIRNIRV